MTAIFAAGIATIMLPIAFGIAVVAQTILGNHSLIFVAGGFLMVILGVWTLSGHGMLPMPNFPVNLNRNDLPSVYTLGVFSGAATTCCAPVLAGVLVLTAMSTTMLEGVLIGFAYVAGMTAPLFGIALAWDRYSVINRNPLPSRLVEMKYFGHEFTIHSSKLIAGSMFVVMGIVTVGLGLTGSMLPTPGSEMVGIILPQLERALVDLFTHRGETMIMVTTATVLIGAVLMFLRRRSERRGRTPAPPSSQQS
jgi:cytochrome c biogenesis protein CcdA